MIVQEIISINGSIEKLYDELCLLEIAGQKDSDEYRAICQTIRSANKYLKDNYMTMYYDREETLLELDSLVRKINYDHFQSDFERVLSSDNIPTLGRTMSYLSKITQYTTECFNHLTAELGSQLPQETDGLDELDFLSSLDDEDLYFVDQYLYQADAIAEWLRLHDFRTIQIFLEILDNRINHESDSVLRESLIKFKYNFIYQNVDSEGYVLGETIISDFTDVHLLSIKPTSDTYKVALKTNIYTVEQLINFIIKSMNSSKIDVCRIMLADMYICAMLDNVDSENNYINEKLVHFVDLYTKKYLRFIDCKKVNLLFIEKLRQKTKRKGNFISRIIKP